MWKHFHLSVRSMYVECLHQAIHPVEPGFTVPVLIGIQVIRVQVEIILHFYSVHCCCAGELILNMDRDTYEKMGLEGKPSLFNGKQHRKYGTHVKLI